MRKYIRQIMRFQAKQNGYKPSKFVHTMWYRLQERKGSHQRHLANIARGTRPKRKWKTAYERTFGLMRIIFLTKRKRKQIALLLGSIYYIASHWNEENYAGQVQFIANNVVDLAIEIGGMKMADTDIPNAIENLLGHMRIYDKRGYETDGDWDG